MVILTRYSTFVVKVGNGKYKNPENNWNPFRIFGERDLEKKILIAKDNNSKILKQNIEKSLILEIMKRSKPSTKQLEANKISMINIH